MPDNPAQQKVLQGVTPSQPKPNGQDVPLDPKIVRMVEFLDRAIRTQNPTIGVVVAAVGVLLGRVVLGPDHLERMVRDVSMAIRVGFYLNHKDK
jgi:hypothetical protein